MRDGYFLEEGWLVKSTLSPMDFQTPVWAPLPSLQSQRNKSFHRYCLFEVVTNYRKKMLLS